MRWGLLLVLAGCPYAPEDDLDRDGYPDDVDCDDHDDDVHPGAVEICDGEDDDCDGHIDEDAPIWYRDADADAYGDGQAPLAACARPDGYVAAPGDCDDADPDVHPDAAEVCDGVDQDCDGVADEGAYPTWYRDDDGDGWGDDALDVVSCIAPAGASGLGGDCDDHDASIHPGASEADCGEVDRNCDGHVGRGDWDRDGWDACEDCDDGHADRHPGADEHCDGIDEDCDGEVDDHAVDAHRWYADEDHDHFGDPEEDRRSCHEPHGYVRNDDDCDDRDDEIHPGAREHCDGVDEDCDDRVDEGACPNEDCENGIDDDRDGRVDCEDPDCDDAPACQAGACPDGDLGSAIGERVATGTNLDQGNDRSGSCGGRGEEVTWRWRAPDDGFFVFDTEGSAYDTVLYARAGGCDGDELACNQDFIKPDFSTYTSSITLELFRGDAIVLVVDANEPQDTGRYVLNAHESTCPDEDLGDATGRVATGSTLQADDTLTASCLRDFGTDVTFAWEAPYDAVWTFDTSGTDFEAGLVLREGGCHGDEIACGGGSWDNETSSWHDARVSTWLDAGERVVVGLGGMYADGGAYVLSICAASAWYPDADGDGYGDPTAPVEACTAPEGYVADATDCDDEDAAVHPGAPETCGDGRDDDCDGDVDEGCDTGPVDTGPVDTGGTDTGPVDTGGTDTGPVDTGGTDTGPADTGGTDTGPADTGGVDTGTSQTAPQNHR